MAVNDLFVDHHSQSTKVYVSNAQDYVGKKNNRKELSEEQRTNSEKRKKNVSHIAPSISVESNIWKKTMRRQNNKPSQRRNQQPWKEKVQKLMLHVVTVSNTFC